MTGRWGTGLLRTALVGVAALLIFGGCAIGGQAVGGSAGDLADRSVSAEDFPVSGATRVPEDALPFALNGLSGSDPATAYPADCRPAAPDNSGAVAYSVIVNGGTTSYTTAVVRAKDSLDTVTAQAQRCPQSRTGADRAASLVELAVAPPPVTSNGVVGAALRRTVYTGDPSHQIATSSLTLIGQRDDVRVYVQYRWMGAAPIDSAAAAGLDSLFTKAVSAAFG